MQAVAAPLQGLIRGVKDNVNTFVFGVLIFSYQAIQNEFPCSCEPELGFCSAYMIMPCLIITVLMLSTDMAFQRAWRFEISSCSCHFRSVLIRCTVKALCMGLLWVGSVLIDAGWFVCCANPNIKDVADLQCKSKSDITHRNATIVTIDEMKMNSRMIGMSLVFAVIFLAGILLPSMKIWAESCCSSCFQREVEVLEMILEVGEEVVSKTIKAKHQEELCKKIEGHINEGKWVKCLDVVEDAINERPKEAGGGNKTTPKGEAAGATATAATAAGATTTGATTAGATRAGATAAGATAAGATRAGATKDRATTAGATRAGATAAGATAAGATRAGATRAGATKDRATTAGATTARATTAGATKDRATTAGATTARATAAGATTAGATTAGATRAQLTQNQHEVSNQQEEQESGF